MKKKILKICIIIVFLFSFSPLIYTSYSQNHISPEDAHKYIGEYRTVCGTVASTIYSFQSEGKPTFLNLNKPYPVFTIVIWGSDRNKFESPPERYYDQKRVCVKGEITIDKGKPQIVVKNPYQIE